MGLLSVEALLLVLVLLVVVVVLMLLLLLLWLELLFLSIVVFLLAAVGVFPLFVLDDLLLFLFTVVLSRSLLYRYLPPQVIVSLSLWM